LPFVKYVVGQFERSIYEWSIFEFRTLLEDRSTRSLNQNHLKYTMETGSEYPTLVGAGGFGTVCITEVRLLLGTLRLMLQSGTAVKLCRSKGEGTRLNEEYEIHKRVWTHVSELPLQVSVPRPINFHRFEPHKVISSLGLSVELPTNIRQKDIFCGIEMTLVPDLDESLKHILSSGMAIRDRRYTPKLTLGMRGEGR